MAEDRMLESVRTGVAGHDGDDGGSPFDRARDLWRPSLGLALYFALTVLAVQFPLRSPALALSSSTLGALSLPLLAMLANLAAFVVAGALFFARKWVPRGARYMTILLLLLEVGLVANFVISLAGEGGAVVSTAVFAISNVAVAVALSFLGIEWMRRAAELGTYETFVCMIVSSVANAAIFILFDLLPAPVGLGLLCLFPAASVWCMGYRRARNAPVYRLGRQTPIAVPWRLMVTICIQGLASGVTQRMVATSGGGGYLPMVAIALLAASVLALVCARLLRLDANRLVHQVGFGIIALGCLVCVGVGYGPSAGRAVLETGGRFAMIMVWVLAAWTIRQERLSANWVYPCTMVAYLAGRLAGMGVATAMGQAGPVIPATVLFVVLMCSVLILGDKRASWGSFLVAEAATPEEDAFEAACRAVFRDAGLTDREQEVAALLARGRNGKYICEQLTISQNTEKYHVRNIYRKLGIHDQQDLMTRVEQATAARSMER